MSLHRFFDLYKYHAPELALIGPALAKAARKLQDMPQADGVTPDALAARRFLLTRIVSDGTRLEQIAKEVVARGGAHADLHEDRPEIRGPRDALRSGFADFMGLLAQEADPDHHSDNVALAHELHAHLQGRGKNVQRTKGRAMALLVHAMLEHVRHERYAPVLRDQPLLRKRFGGLQAELDALAEAVRLQDREGVVHDDDPEAVGRDLVLELIGDCIAASRDDDAARAALLGSIADLEDRLAEEHKLPPRTTA